jgi:hypothetical protein
VDASILSLGSGSQTLNLKLWFYADYAVKDGEKYQYGIVTVGYKNAAAGGVVVKSEIAWQAETDTNQYAAAKVPAKGTKYQVPATPPVVTITTINSSTPGTAVTGFADTADRILITVSGLDLNYNYYFFRQVSSDGAEVNYGGDGSLFGGNDIWSSDYNSLSSWPYNDSGYLRISNFLENGTTLSIVASSGWGGGLVSTTDTSTRRLVIEYGTADWDGVLEYTTANTTVSPLSSKQKAVGAIPRS